MVPNRLQGETYTLSPAAAAWGPGNSDKSLVCNSKPSCPVDDTRGTKGLVGRTRAVGESYSPA